MTTWELLKKAWDWEPSIVIGCVILLAAYFLATRFRFGRQAVYFLVADIVLLITLVGPLDVLADDYLFSAHMMEHLILTLIVPPLLLLSIPGDLMGGLLRRRAAAAVERTLGSPLPAWLLGMGTLWLWHLPALYNAALASENVHIIQHLMFLVTATIFWWPVLAPEGYRRLTAIAAIFYLLFGAIASSLLGALLTFAPMGLYPLYSHPGDKLGALPLIRNGWGLSPAGDQQLGGLYMWAFGGLVFLWAILLVFARWFLRREGVRESQQPAAGFPVL